MVGGKTVRQASESRMNWEEVALAAVAGEEKAAGGEGYVERGQQ